MMDQEMYSYGDMLEEMQLRHIGCHDKNLLDWFIKIDLVTYVPKNDERYFCKNDIDILERLMEWNTNEKRNVYRKQYISDERIYFDVIKIADGTYLRFVNESDISQVPAFVKSIVYLNRESKGASKEFQLELQEANIITSNRFVADYLADAYSRSSRLDKIKKTDFTNSSTYMGIKKDIADFVVESIWGHMRTESVLVDLMCGSGSVSHAFSMFLPVYASDAQMFCRLLAKVHGHGLSLKEVMELTESIHSDYLQNYQELQKRYGEELRQENDIFHMDTADAKVLFDEYEKYASKIALYSSTSECLPEILSDVTIRRSDPKKKPYCLFTLYYAGIFFGLEQCIQIDSIRYAIDCIQNDDTREWMLGILVIAVSVVASNYGGHFAQPIQIKESNIKKILEKRGKSVWLEFSRRALAIADESEKNPFTIHPVPGPWQEALKQIRSLTERDVVIYLDAPYKREEYSRFYHVLETLAKYDYPSSEYKGRVRSLKLGERFHSEFSSRSVSYTEHSLVNIITEILNVAYLCAWSYSDNGLANMVNVINEVKKITDCEVYIYCANHRHNLQGRRKNAGDRDGRVREYSVIFLKK